jgi:uncharacterized membrane protein YciS (DUF1049 family)
MIGLSRSCELTDKLEILDSIVELLNSLNSRIYILWISFVLAWIIYSVRLNKMRLRVEELEEKLKGIGDKLWNQ